MSDDVLAQALDAAMNINEKPTPLADRLAIELAARNAQVVCWRPILEAPKDGTWVCYASPSLGLWIGNEPGNCYRGRWNLYGVDWRGGAYGVRDETHFAIIEPPAVEGKP